MSMKKYHAGSCEDQEILSSIRKAIDASIRLRSKKHLIEAWIGHVNVDTQATTDLQRFVFEQKEADLSEIITTKKPRPEETRRFVVHASRDGAFQTSCTQALTD